jgi:hypothetical protein
MGSLKLMVSLNLWVLLNLWEFMGFCGAFSGFSLSKLKSEDSLDLMVFRAIYGLINFVGPLSEFSQTKGEGGKGKEKGPEIYRCCTTLSIVELPLARYGHNCSFLACSGQTLCIGSFWPSFCIAITIVDIPLTITS